MHKPSLHTLRSEELAHFPQISFVPSECSARFNTAVADQEMNMFVRSVGMHREQYLIAPKESLRELLCDPECFSVSQLIIVLRRKGDRDFIGKVCILCGLLPEQLSCHENIAGEMIPVTVDAPIEIRLRFDHAFPYLLRLPAEQIVGGAAKLCGRFAGAVIHIDITEHPPLPLR